MLQQIPSLLGIDPLLLTLLIAWSLAWKGIALWKSAQGGERTWFVILLLINTLGILEILYIYVFGKDKEKSVTI